MALNANKVPATGNSGSFPIMEAGSYPGRLAQLIDLGVQPQKYKKEVKPPKNEFMMTWELCDEFGLDADGKEMTDKPRWQSERMPLNSLGSELAKSTQRYEVLDPTGAAKGDFAALLGNPAMVTLNVTQDGKYNNVSAVTPMRAKEANKLTKLAQDPKVFDLDAPDMVIYGSLPDWVKKIIKSNLNFGGSKLEGLLKEDAPDTGGEGPSEDDEASW